MPSLEDALILAAESHRGQKDKAGRPYILHPLSVMARLGATASDEERIVALLHDVVEDSPVTIDALRERGYSEEIIAAVDALTKRAGEESDYEAFVRRAKANPLSRRVQIADVTDNLDLSRIAAPTEKDYARMERYRKALEVLSS